MFSKKDRKDQKKSLFYTLVSAGRVVVRNRDGRYYAMGEDKRFRNSAPFPSPDVEIFNDV